MRMFWQGAITAAIAAFLAAHAASAATAPPAGQIAEFATGITANSQPNFVALGPDGNLWFTEFNAN